MAIRKTYKKNDRQYDLIYTNGNEYIDENNEFYIGFYIIDPKTKQVYKGTEVKNQLDREQLFKVPKSLSDPMNKKYYDLTELKFNFYTGINTYFPRPSEKDYKKGKFTRYFVKKINEDKIYELSQADFKTVNNVNKKGPNGYLFQQFKFEWGISGPIEDVKSANERKLRFINKSYPGIINYLGDLDEFHETKPIVQRQTLDREYPDGEKMHPNLPAAYGFSNQKNQACSNCIFKNNNACKLWQANIRNNYWCGRWKAIPDTTY